MTTTTASGLSGGIANDTWLPLIGRVLLALLFVMSGYGKIGGAEQTAQYMATQGGLPLAGALVWLVVLIELVGGIAIIVGWQARWAALILALFTLAAALLFHDYWSMEGGARYANYLNFWKNLGLAGGFLMIASMGPGRWSLDAKRGA